MAAGPPAVPANKIFDDCFKLLIDNEGGLSMDPNDNGNWTGGRKGYGVLKGTKYGISAAQYPNLEIKNLSLSDAKAIYQRDYWKPFGCDKLSFPKAFQVFDAGVNHSPRAVKNMIELTEQLLAEEVKEPTGLNEVSDALFIMAFNSARLRYFTTLHDWRHYGTGWAERIAKNLRTAVRHIL